MLRHSIRAAESPSLRRACAKTVKLSSRASVCSRRWFNQSSNSADAASEANVTRPRPAPSFNVNTDLPERKLNPDSPAMDDSFIGLSGGQIFHEMMLRHNVDTIFGYSGGAILPVFDGIYNSPHFKFILPRHEQGAGHMAEGYARATGKTGVVIVTSGPGATNVVTPMQDALSDGTPMVVFSGQVATKAIGTDAFQEADVVGITRSCTKWNVMVKSIAELPRRINEAFEIASSGRPGPVLVDLPKDVTAGILRESIPTESTIPSKSLANLSALAATQFQNAAIKRSAELINKAKRPIIYAGNGAVASEGAPELLTALADKAHVPVTTTLHGLGAFDETDPKSLRMLGMHGSAYANKAIQKADLIIALGARFDERVTGTITKFAPEARLAALEKRGGIIHFEISPKNINKVVEATEAVEGDVGANLAKLLPLVNKVEPSSRKEWFDQIDEWKNEFPLTYQEDKIGEPIRPQTVIKRLSNLTHKSDKKTIITTGVGQHQMWAAQFYKFRQPRTIVTSGGLGTMGYGLPAAIGAKVACPDAHVIDIDGDASFNMTLSELSTAVQYNIGMKAIVLNNEEQGMVTQWQSLFYEDRYSHTHQKNPNFMKLAEATGVKGIRIEKLEELDEKLQEMLDWDGPVLVEVIVDQKVPVLPMVPGGKGLDECIVYDATVEAERKALREQRLGKK
jgi:acetolactate synthase-1/2/3 large subunit